MLFGYPYCWDQDGGLLLVIDAVSQAVGYWISSSDIKEVHLHSAGRYLPIHRKATCYLSDQPILL